MPLTLDGTAGLFGNVTGGNISGTFTGGNSSATTVTSTGSTTTRSLANRFADVVNVLDFGADPTGVVDSQPAIQAAINTGKIVFVPNGNYKINSSLIISGDKKHLTCDTGVVFFYYGTGAAFEFSGTNHNIQITEITAPAGQHCVKYYNLSNSKIEMHAVGACLQSCIQHDAVPQTGTHGNNRWIIHRIEANGVPYGIKIDNHATWTLEGEYWDVKVIFSATVASLRIGVSTASQKVRWNEYHIAPDAQGVTPVLVDVYQDYNYINLKTWQETPGQIGVRFNTGTGNNMLFAQTGVQGNLTVVDNGNNFKMVPGTVGQIIVGNQLHINSDPGTGGTAFASADNVASGTDTITIENKNSTNVITKYAGIKWRGRDTINTGKDIGAIRAYPVDSNFVDSGLLFYTRESNVFGPAFEIKSDKSSSIVGDKLIIQTTKTPTPSSANGVAGSICWDSNYIYVCVAANTWKRASLLAY